MAFNGLLQGVMQGIAAGAKGGAEVAKGYYEDERKIDVYKEMADIEEQKMLRIDEVKRNRDIEDIGRKGEAEAKSYKAKMSDKDFVKSLRTEAEAKHVESAASAAQATLAKMSIDEKRKVNSMIDEYENPNTTPERKASIMEGLKVRGIVKPGEFDTEKVTTETTDPETGAVTKTERTQKRTATSVPGASPTPAGGAAKPWEKAWNK